jgi:hypothetical protein
MSEEAEMGLSTTSVLSREEATNVIRSIFRRCGYCIAEHGTRGRDLDLVAVPWTDRAGMPSYIVGDVIEAINGAMLGDPEIKPHGRVAYSISPVETRAHDMWYVDLSVVVPEEYRDDIDPRPRLNERLKYREARNA